MSASESAKSFTAKTNCSNPHMLRTAAAAPFNMQQQLHKQSAIGAAANDFRSKEHTNL
jgi:hypothetical protein